MEQSLNKNDTQPKDDVYEPTTFVNYEDMSFEFGKSDNISIFMNKYEQSLKKFKEENTDGKNDEKIAICYNNMASVLLNQTKYQQSLDLYNEALSICLKLDPNSENLNMAAIYHNMGWLNVERGSSRDALKFTEKAIRIRTKLLDLNHPDVAISYNNQSVIYLSQGKISQAMKVCAKVLEIRKALYPDGNSPFLAESYINRGVILENMGELEEALESANKAVEIYIKLYGENFRELATIENNKGNLNSHLGREVEALGNFFKGLKIYRNLNSRNYLMSTILDNLACLFEKKRFSLANLKEVLTKSHQLRLHFVGKGEYDTRNLWRKVYYVDMKKSLLEVEAST